MSDILVLQVLAAVCGTVAFVSSLSFLRRYLELKHTRRSTTLDRELALRLERIEQAVDTTALEIERLGETNRFVTKLLGERVVAPTPSAEKGRVVTPH